MSTLRQKIAYNASFSVAVRIFDSILAIVLTAYLARYLGPVGFGNYIIVFTYWNIFIVLADLGLYQITVREISQNKENESKIISNAFTLRLSATVLVFFVGSFLLYLFPYSSDLKEVLLIGAAGFWAISTAQILPGLFQKYLRMDKIAIAEIITRIFNFILTLYVIEKNLGLIYIIGALSLSSILNLCITYKYARQFTKLSLAFNFNYWRKMVQEGWPLAISAVFVMVYFRLNAIILSLLKGEEAVGIFGVGYKILENLIYFPVMFVGLVMPIMSLAAKNDFVRFTEVVQKAFNALLVFIIPMVFFTFLLSDKIVYTIGGKNFPESAGVLNILIIATAFISLAALLSNAIIALGEQKYLAKIYLIGAITSVLINIFLISIMSYIGAAWATLFTEFLVTALMALHLKNFSKFVPGLEKLFKIAIAAAIGCAVIFFVEDKVDFLSPITALGIQLSLGGLSYLFMLFYLKGLSMEELGLFLNKKT